MGRRTGPRNGADTRNATVDLTTGGMVEEEVATGGATPVAGDPSPAPTTAPTAVAPATPAAVPAGLTITTPRVLVYDQSGKLGASVRSSVAEAPDVADDVEVAEVRTARALATQLTTGRFDVLVAGPGLDTRAGFERLRIIREELPSMQVVLASEHLREHDVRDVVRAGAIDAVDLPLPADELTAAVSRALQISDGLRDERDAGSAIEPVPTEAPLPGRVITIASASGGCGKTFLATNLAWFLTHHGGRKVCIVDLDLQFGEVTASLRLRPRYTVTDLIQQSEEEDGQMEAHVVEFCELHDTGIYVLAAPRDPTEAISIRPEDIGRVIDAARAHFDDVIVDTPPALADSVVVAFNRSDELFVMATLDVPSIRNMQVFLGTLERLQVPTDGVRLILNKAESNAGMEVHQVLKLFPQGFDATLPYAREVQRSINVGRPVLLTDPATPISHQLGESLRRLLPPEEQVAFDAYEVANRPRRLRRWLRNGQVAS